MAQPIDPKTVILRVFGPAKYLEPLARRFGVPMADAPYHTSHKHVRIPHDRLSDGRLAVTQATVDSRGHVKYIVSDVHTGREEHRSATKLYTVINMVRDPEPGAGPTGDAVETPTRYVRRDLDPAAAYNAARATQRAFAPSLPLPRPSDAPSPAQLEAQRIDREERRRDELRKGFAYERAASQNAVRRAVATTGATRAAIAAPILAIRQAAIGDSIGRFVHGAAQVQTGPRGGKFVISATGKKWYVAGKMNVN